MAVQVAREEGSSIGLCPSQWPRGLRPSRSLASIVRSNPAGGMDVCLL
jgi:hypothetical protein